MLSHVIPSTDRAWAQSPRAETRPAQARSRAEGPRGGSISLPLHPSFRRQGADLDSLGVPPGAGEGRFRRRLRLSVARCARARLRRPRAHRRDRRPFADDAALFAGARRLRDRASRHERDPAPRFGGPRFPRGAHQVDAGPRGRGGVRWAGPQVPDLGAGALPGPSRGRAGAGPAPARRARGSGVREDAAVSPAAPAEFSHVPVLLEEAMAALEPRAGGVYVDGTFGAGGYARALLDRGATVIAIDRDPSAIRAGAALAASSGGRLRLAEGRFGELDAIARSLGVEAADGVVLDIGVSSMQLDEAARGFSLRFDAPLDMRMGDRKS